MLRLVVLAALHSAAALRLPTTRRAALVAGFAAAATPLASHARLTEYSAGALNIDMEKKEVPKVEVSLNKAELKLRDLVAKSVAEKEKSLGFKFEAEDISEIENILRNKYCGKSGLYSGMEGGTCQEVVISAGYCGSDPRFTSSAGCEEDKKPLPTEGGGRWSFGGQ